MDGSSILPFGSMRKRFLFSLKEIKQVFEEIKPTQICLVFPRVLESQFAWAIEEIRKASKSAPVIIMVADGEAIKEWGEVQSLLLTFFDLHLDRSSLVVALGGASLTDAVGFACSIFKRGIACVYVPTTLLGQVDGSVGNKTGINFHGTKNQIGVFKDPAAIVIDMRFLKSISDEQFVNGLGEVVKAGFIGDKTILKLIERKGKTLAGIHEASVLLQLIQKSIGVKEKYSRHDQYDFHERQMLNFGHTVGHAIELKYGLGHGRAVLIGCDKELSIGEKLGITNPSMRLYFLKLLQGLGVELPNIPVDSEMVSQDKKMHGEYIQIPVVTSLGKGKVVSISFHKFLSLLSSV